jgi:hypothetical protein
MSQVLTYSNHDGGLVRELQIPGPVMSGVIEYDAFEVNDNPFGYTPVQSGTLRFMGDHISSLIQDNNIVISDTVLGFSISSLLDKPSYIEGDYEQYFNISVSNNSNTVVLFMRKTVITITSTPF